MNENQTQHLLSASELSEVLQVPRTTVNDWLSRYSAYITVVQRGKRRLYTQDAVEVLRRVAKLRDAGLAGFDIEEELSKKHAVQPEVAQESAPEPVATPNAPQSAPSATAPVGAEASGSWMPATLNEWQQVAQLMERSLNRQQEDMRRSGRRNLVYFMALLLLIFVSSLLAVWGIMTWRVEDQARQDELFRNQQEMNLHFLNYQKLQDERQAEERKERNSERSEARKELERERSLAAEQLTGLKEDLKRQQEEFAAHLQKLEADFSQKSALEAARSRDEFASKQLELLKRLEAGEAKLQATESDLQKLKSENSDLRGRIDEQRQVLEQRSEAMVPAVPETTLEVEKNVAQ